MAPESSMTGTWSVLVMRLARAAGRSPERRQVAMGCSPVWQAAWHVVLTITPHRPPVRDHLPSSDTGLITLAHHLPLTCRSFWHGCHRLLSRSGRSRCTRARWKYCYDSATRGAMPLMPYMPMLATRCSVDDQSMISDAVPKRPVLRLYWRMKRDGGHRFTVRQHEDRRTNGGWYRGPHRAGRDA